MIEFTEFDEKGEFIELLAAKSIASWSQWRKSSYKGTERFCWLKSDIQNPLFNPILLARFSLPQDEEVMQLFETMHLNSPCASMLVTPFTSPRGIERLTPFSALKKVAEPVGMAINIGATKDLLYSGSSLQLVLVNNTTKLSVWSSMFSNIFNLPTGISNNWHDLHESIGYGIESNWRHFIGFSSDKPVGVCSVFIHQNALTLFNLGVLNMYRNQGFGSELVSKSIRYCTKPESDKVTLTAMESAIGLFKSLGFQRYWKGDYYMSVYD